MHVRRLGRLVVRLSAAVLVLFLLGAVALAWMLATPSGLRSAVRLAPALSGGAIAVGGVSGELLGESQLDELRYEAAGTRVSIHRLRLRVLPRELLRSRLRLARLEVQGLEVLLPESAQTQPQPGPPRLLTRLPLDLVIDSAKLDQFDLRKPGAAPFHLDRAELSASWRGTTVEIVRLASALPQTGPLELAAKAELHTQRIDFQRLQLRGPGEISAEGRLGLGDVASDLRISWRELRWPLAGPAEKNLRASGVTGEAALSGTLRAWRYELRSKGLVQSIAAELATQGQGSEQEVRIDQLQLDAGQGQVALHGSAGWQPAMHADLQAELRKVDPALFVPGWPGRLNGRLSVRTTRQKASAPNLHLELTLDRSRLRDAPLQLNARGDYQAGALRLADLQLGVGATRLSASGQATPPFALDAHLASSDLASLHPDLGGTVDAQLSLQGPADDPHLRTRGRAQGLRYRGNSIGALDWQADVDPRAPSQIELTAANARLGIAVPRLSFKASGDEKYHRLQLDVLSERGEIALTVHGGYDRKRREWGGELSAMRAAPQNLPDWKLEKAAGLLLGRKRQSLEPACLAGGAGRICFRLEQNVTRAGLRLSWQLEQLKLASFKPLLPRDYRVQGEVDGHGAVEIGGGDVRAIDAELKVPEARLSAPGVAPFVMLPSELSASQDAQGTLRTHLDLRFAQGSVAAELAAQRAASFGERPLSGQLRLDVPDLAFLQPLLSELSRVGGRLGGEMELSGSVAQPRLRGQIALTDGHARLITPGIDLQQVQVRLSGEGAGALAVDGSLASGGGTLSLAGSVDPTQTPLLAELRLQGENFQAAATPDARVWVTPDLTLLKDPAGLHLLGTLQVPRAEITPRKGVGNQGVTVSGDQVLVGAQAPPPRQPLKLYATVRLGLGEAVSFSGFGLSARLAGGVTLIEEPLRETRAQGELNLVNGRYKAYGQQLNIETGRLLFEGGPVTRPGVDLYATRKPQSDVTVGVRVRGTLDRPLLTLQSDPPMPREQQLAWLVLGRPLDQSSASDRSALTQAALSLGLSGGESLAQRLGKGLRLDTISVAGQGGGSEVAASAGAVAGSQASLARGAYQDQTQSAQLTLGKYLTPKLFVSYGVSLFQPGQTFRLLYDLGHGFKLQSESGVASGGDLIYTKELGR